ncbi:MAG: type IV toxin-antitoxin system AbiEi family antitoxin domain-containing protein [Microlunatus sp.]
MTSVEISTGDVACSTEIHRFAARPVDFGERPQCLGMDNRVRELIASQAGVISRAQALSSGLSARQVDHRVKNGEWVRLHPGVFRSSLVSPSAEQALRAAALWADDGILTGLGAAWWWYAVSEPPMKWEFLIGGTSGRVVQARVRLLRRWVDPTDVTTHRDLRVIRRPLAVLRAAAALEAGRVGHGVRLIDRCKQTGLATGPELEAAFIRNRGTWGTKTMGELLERTGDRAHSDLERLGVSLLRDAGITGFVVNLGLKLSTGRVAELDVAFEELKIGLEFDGFPYHSSMQAQQADALRQNDLVRDGWIILRFPPGELREHSGRFIRLVRETLQRRTAELLSS